MRFLLEGISEEEGKEIIANTEKMIRSIFNNENVNVMEINIPIDFRNTVNKKYSQYHQIENYITEDNVCGLRALNIILDSKDVEIVLDKNLLGEGNRFYSVLYHELIHAKFRRDLRGKEYLNINIQEVNRKKNNDKQSLVEALSFILIDEYNAYKEMYIKYPNSSDNLSDNLKETLCDFITLECLIEKGTVQNVIKSDFIQGYFKDLSILLAEIKVNKNNEEFVVEFMKKQIKNYTIIDTIKRLNKVLSSFSNNIPSKEEFYEVQKCVSKLFDSINCCRFSN